MPNFTHFNRLEYLDSLVRKKATGSPEELAKKLRISVRSVHVWIDKLKDMGAPIAYDKQRRTYCYLVPGGFNFGFKEEK
ncbi:HTH domain-containing protein [Anseongella ginsenosidimutans]|uniref:HTH domain-containing protein n=1 Tax=Anseongella ginsenosidimutans TaxID=496056 RepID=A0A4R3KMR4_9SPHI|nr:HTH domain-containing protein [Anseongella ginsenosidimutans]QEC52448.1 HTH domain-containing protein [Anseongella ginsenosidimutans]TCS84258.1 HTH domain-containing protein [Anseongella ginsenosidimutans]